MENIIRYSKHDGLSSKNKDYRFRMIKGRIAEALIEELFLALGYDVFRYGMENTIPGISKLLKGVKSEVVNDIKRMPDFVIKKGSKLFFIEVKFRKDEYFDKDDKSLKNYPYKNCYFVIVSKEHIKCISYIELTEKNQKVTPNSTNYLGNKTEFDLNNEIIKDFCEFTKIFFKNVV